MKSASESSRPDHPVTPPLPRPPRPGPTTDGSTHAPAATGSNQAESAASDSDDRVPVVIHTVTDIANDDDLVRYAVQAQLTHIDRTPESITGPNSPISRADLARYLAGSQPFPPEVLRALDDIVVAIASDRGHVGGLAAFAERVREHAEHVGMSVRVPPGWTRDNLNTRTSDELHVLAQASTLLNTFIAANQVDVPSDVVRTQHHVAIEQVADRLILLASGPPTPRHYEAQALLGALAKYAFEIVLGRIEVSIRHKPLGFRSWRPLTKLMMIARNDRTDERLSRELKARLPNLVKDANKLRDDSINPGRSLDLEFFIAIPWGWAGGGDPDDQVDQALLERAHEEHATLRERATAAMGYWQRAHENGRANDKHVRRQMAGLIHMFDDQQTRPDIATGLRWVARTLESVLKTGAAVCGDWPAVDEPWYEAVMNHANSLEAALPESVRVATKNLFLHALLQNAGVERRKAIDALRTGGLVEPVAQTLSRLLLDPETRDEPWLRIRVLFALGFMQARDVLTEANLVDAAERAYENVTHGHPSPAQIGELQTVLFSIGDIFGVSGVEDQASLDLAGRVRNELASLLTDLAESRHPADKRFYTVSRALAYLLTFTAQPGADDLSLRLLNKMRDHDDHVTKKFSRWALEFRFAPDHSIRPLLFGV